MQWAMTRFRELLGISFPLMSPAVVACSVEGIKAASRVFRSSRLGIADTAGICITKAMNRPLAALQRRPPSLG